MAQSEDPRPPFGDGAVGARVAREFGNLGVFTGTVTSVKHGKSKRVGTLYHVTYDDGDAEDLDADEFQYAFELSRMARNIEGECEERIMSNIEGECEGEVTSFDNPPPAPGTNLLAPTWTNLRPTKRFKPVISRKGMSRR